mgnify:FL=1|jgi:hypothetical protein
MTTKPDSKDSIWDRLLVVFGVNLRCPACGKSFEKGKPHKYPLKKIFEKEEDIQPGFIDTVTETTAMYIVWRYTYQCPHCGGLIQEDKKEEEEQFEEELSAEEKQALIDRENKKK